MSFANRLPRASVNSRPCTTALVVIICAAFAPAPLLAQRPDQSLPIPQGADAVGTRLGGESIFGGEERLPTVTDGGRLNLPPISTATTSTDRIGNGSVPRPFFDEAKQPETPLPEAVQQRDDQWLWSVYSFAAANTFSHPLYFEDVMLERHGHERFPKLQPMISGARFFATVPMLPYLMTIRPPADCEYKLGHFRPGDCVYPYIQRPPYVRNAAIVEAAAITGTAVILP
jgi:hypothetical protein